MKQKVLTVALAAIMAFSCVGLSACGSSKSHSSMTNKQAADAAYAKKLHDAAGL